MPLPSPEEIARQDRDGTAFAGKRSHAMASAATLLLPEENETYGHCDDTRFSRIDRKQWRPQQCF
jgi:hypothetical protein